MRERKRKPTRIDEEPQNDDAFIKGYFDFVEELNKAFPDLSDPNADITIEEGEVSKINNNNDSRKSKDS